MSDLFLHQLTLVAISAAVCGLLIGALVFWTIVRSPYFSGELTWRRTYSQRDRESRELAALAITNLILFSIGRDLSPEELATLSQVTIYREETSGAPVISAEPPNRTATVTST